MPLSRGKSGPVTFCRAASCGNVVSRVVGSRLAARSSPVRSQANGVMSRRSVASKEAGVSHAAVCSIVEIGNELPLSKVSVPSDEVKYYRVAVVSC